MKKLIELRNNVNAIKNIPHKHNKINRLIKKKE